MSTKYVVAIVREDALEQIQQRLSLLQVRGLSVSKVRGVGEYRDFFSLSQMTEHLQIQIFVDASKVDAVVAAVLDAADSDLPGAGIIAVLPVEQFLHVRTRTERLPRQTLSPFGARGLEGPGQEPLQLLSDDIRPGCRVNTKGSA